MKKCQQFRQWIWLAAYNELPVDQQNQLEKHIEGCPECQLDYEEATKTIELLDQKIQLEPTEAQLAINRDELHQRLLLMTQPAFRKQWFAKLWQIISLDVPPAFRFATAAAILMVGILLGKLLFSQGSLQVASGQSALPGLFDSNLSNIESIQYDPATRQVTIIMNTINDVTIRGNVERPEIQQILAQTLMTDERPNVRLKSVRALQNMKKLDKKVISALSEVVDKEQNPGIRLKAVKLLTSIPINSTIKEIMTKVLVRVFLNDSNSAIRIEAFKGLSKIENGSIAPLIFNAAKNDSSEYIRSKANQILDRTQNPVVPQ